jgi:hypothetical protein
MKRMGNRKAWLREKSTNTTMTRRRIEILSHCTAHSRLKLIETHRVRGVHVLKRDGSALLPTSVTRDDLCSQNDKTGHARFDLRLDSSRYSYGL